MSKLSCPLCGRAMSKEEKPHGIVTRVVKPHQTFSGVKALQPVDVCELDASHGATLKGTISIEEYQKLLLPKAVKQPANSKTSVQMAAEYMEISRQEFERDKARRAAKLVADLEAAKQSVKDQE